MEAHAHSLFARSTLYTDPVLPPYVDVTNITDVAVYYTRYAVPQRFNPGIVVASIAVAALGAYSTLLLLGRRTSNKGARNVFLLMFAATTMSCVGIWGMHFIGMHMSLAPVKGVNWYIAFNPGFTVFSLFVPCIALGLAFYFLDQTSSFSLLRTALSGMLTGGIVSLMHYSASLMANFRVSYAPGQTVASIALACLASTVALAAFFRFRAQWEDSWWKRLCCALVLACGVSGMHYIGVWGTSYRVRESSIGNEAQLMYGNRKNNIVVIAIAVMCFFIVVISTFIGVTDVLVARETRRKARKVVIASATFDRSGRMLVKADGSMPMVVIETPLCMAEVMDALDKRQSTFQWLFTVSWDWDMLAPFLRAIAARFSQRQQQQHPLDGGYDGFVDADGSMALPELRRGVKGGRGRRISLEHSSQDKAQRGPKALCDFRDRVINAANQLALELDIPLHQVGVLYDNVMPTGTRKARGAATTRQPQRKPNGGMPSYPGHDGGVAVREDDEISINMTTASIFGEGDDEQEGVTLFLVRELATTGAAAAAWADEAQRYRQRGYRMTEPRFVASVLADRFAVAKPEMETLLDALRTYAKRGTRPVVQPGGVYAGLFAVRASTSKQGGLDVLVYNFARHQIPAYRLPDVPHVTADMRSFLRMLDQMPMDEAMRTCERESVRAQDRKRGLVALAAARSEAGGDEDDVDADADAITEEEQSIDAMIRFQTALFIALDALHNSVRFYPRLSSTARLSAEVLEVPSSLDDSTAPAQIILVQTVLPEENSLSVSVSSHHALAGGGSTPHVASLPTDVPSAATPFVFTPYTLFAKAQMMLLKGRQAHEFEDEVALELRKRYPSSVLQEVQEKALLAAAATTNGVGTAPMQRSSAGVAPASSSPSGSAKRKMSAASLGRASSVDGAGGEKSDEEGKEGAARDGATGGAVALGRAAVHALPTLRKLSDRFNPIALDARRASKDSAKRSVGGGGGTRRVSSASVLSRDVSSSSAAAATHELGAAWSGEKRASDATTSQSHKSASATTGPSPQRRPSAANGDVAHARRRGSPGSPTGTSYSGMTALEMRYPSSSTAVAELAIREQPAAKTTSVGNGSLGIRRYIETGGDVVPPRVPSSHFARAPEDMEEVGDDGATEVALWAGGDVDAVRAAEGSVPGQVVFTAQQQQHQQRLRDYVIAPAMPSSDGVAASTIARRSSDCVPPGSAVASSQRHLLHGLPSSDGSVEPSSPPPTVVRAARPQPQPRAPRRRGSRGVHPLTPSASSSSMLPRPSTAPTSGQRLALQARPRTAGAGSATPDAGTEAVTGVLAHTVSPNTLLATTTTTHGVVVGAQPPLPNGRRARAPPLGATTRSGIVAAAAAATNEASVLARLRSDDWSARQLQALERGPSSTALLGVDF